MKIRLSLFALFVLLLVPVSFSQAQEVCSSDGTLEEFQTTFVNDTNTDVVVHWINTECVEEAGTPIAAGENLQFTTYDGHEFVFRNSNGDALLMYQVNTLNVDGEVPVGRTIAEGASALVMWQTINPARAERGLEPIYFSGVLYDTMDEAAETAEGDYSAFGESVVTLAQDGELGWAGNAEGPLSGELLSVDALAESITTSVQESIDTDDTFGWLNPDVLSFAVYADENIYGELFSTKSQPTLALENSETEDASAVTNIAGTLTADAESSHEFQAEEGVLYAISLASDEFDTVVRVYDAGGVEVGVDDDGGEGLNSLLMFTAPADGTYTIGVDSFNDAAIGAYTLRVTHTTAVVLNFLTTENSTRNQSLDVEAGITYFVNVNSNDFDTVVAILDENGVEVISDDDGGEGLNSLAVFTAATTGSYTITVSSFTEGATGEFNILIGAFTE